MRSRALALGGLMAVAGAALAAALLSLGAGSHSYALEFQTAGQLVDGNQVLLAGRPVGSVESVSLTGDYRARVEVKLDEPVREGVTATIRQASLSGIANRYVELAPGPGAADPLPSGSVIADESTTSPVDLDQLFDTFDRPTRRALGRVIEGQATVFEADAEGANRTYGALPVALYQSRLTLGELADDGEALRHLVADGADVAGEVAERRAELTELIDSAGVALRTIAEREGDLDASLAAAPGALRQANTTFLNLRAALDDLDPLVADAKRSTRDLTPFLARLRPVAVDAVGVFRDLRRTLRSPRGDLTGALEGLPPLARRTALARGPAMRALEDSEPIVGFVRPYSPDLVGWLAKFGQITSYYDANGHYARVAPAATDRFGLDPISGLLSPITPAEQFDGLVTGLSKRCPGGSTQPIPGSNPFLDDGRLIGSCDPASVPPGP